MFKRELLTLALVILLAFTAAVTGAWYITHLYKQEIKRATTDSIPSLLNSSAVAQRVEENWGHLQTVRQAQSYPVRSNLIVQIRANQIEPYIKDYKKTLDPGPETELYGKLCSARDQFKTLRHDYFELILADRLPESERLYYADLVTAYGRYESAAKNLYLYDVDDVNERVEQITRLTRFMPWAAGGMGLLLFLAGTAFGLKAALGGLGFVTKLLGFGSGRETGRK
jgi:hypothetical protein